MTRRQPYDAATPFYPEKREGLFDDLNDAHGVGYTQGRADALEEAAALFDIGSVPVACCDVAREIRKLKEKQG